VRSLILFLLSFSVAVSLFAQDATALRGDGGELSVLVKRPSQLSGTFGFTFGGNRSNALTGSFGGTLVPDRVWFFASAQRDEHPLTAIYGVPAADRVTPVIDGKVIAQLGSAQSLSGSFFSNQAFLTGQRSDFRTLHFTNMLSPSAFFSLSASQNSTK
jgi:hypothetical protein